jgi:hypothetical protein
MINSPYEIVLVAGRHAPGEVMRRTIGAGRGGLLAGVTGRIVGDSPVRPCARVAVRSRSAISPYRNMAAYLTITIVFN